MAKFWRQAISKGQSWVDPNSLQARLTAGLVLASLVGIGTMTTWVGWRTQHILVDRHRQNTSLVADRLRKDVQYYAATMPPQTALKKVIDHRTTGDVAIWVQIPTGEILAQSETLTMGSWQTSGIAPALLQKQLPPGNHILTINDWRLVVCAQPTAIEGLPPSRLYVADDITADISSLHQLVRMLLLSSGLVVSLLTLAFALYIRRTLSPIRELNRLAGTVTADSLANHQLTLAAAPTEVKELAQSYNRMLARLAQAWTQQKRFFRDMSHELRTPLSLVQGYVESALRRGDNLTPAQREGLTIAAAETNRTVHLLTQLLELARLENRQLPLNLALVDLKEVVYGAIAIVEADHDPSRSSPPSTRITVEGDSLYLKVDTPKLQTVLVELLDNALRYSPPPPPIAVHLLPQSTGVLIQVQDWGSGIPRSCQDHIFEPFYRVDDARSRSTGGTGLGLTLARTLVDRMGGHLRVESNPDQGSIFTITLPFLTEPGETHGRSHTPCGR